MGSPRPGESEGGRRWPFLLDVSDPGSDAREAGGPGSVGRAAGFSPAVRGEAQDGRAEPGRSPEPISVVPVVSARAGTRAGAARARARVAAGARPGTAR